MIVFIHCHLFAATVFQIFRTPSDISICPRTKKLRPRNVVVQCSMALGCRQMFIVVGWDLGMSLMSHQRSSFSSSKKKRISESSARPICWSVHFIMRSDSKIYILRPSIGRYFLSISSFIQDRFIKQVSFFSELLIAVWHLYLQVNAMRFKLSTVYYTYKRSFVVLGSMISSQVVGDVFQKNVSLKCNVVNGFSPHETILPASSTCFSFTKLGYYRPAWIKLIIKNPHKRCTKIIAKPFGQIRVVILRMRDMSSEFDVINGQPEHCHHVTTGLVGSIWCCGPQCHVA